MQTNGKKTMLYTTACLIAGMAFFAGVLFGTLFSAQRPAPYAQSGASSAPVPAQQSGDVHSPEFDAHIAELRAEIARNPKEALNWIHLGNLFFDNDHYTDAIEAYEKALEISPDNADVLTDLGTMYRYSGDGVAAVRAYDKAIAVNPKHQNARFNKGLTQSIELADPQAGLASWKELLQVVPEAKVGDNVPLGTVLDSLLTSAATHLEAVGKPEVALQAYDLSLAENPAFAPALSHKAALLEKMNRGMEAYGVWQTLLGVDPAALTPDGRKVADIVNR